MADTPEAALADELVEAMESMPLYHRLIAERAAKEAVTAERKRITDGVRELIDSPAAYPAPMGPTIRADNAIVRAVLAIVNPEAALAACGRSHLGAGPVCALQAEHGGPHDWDLRAALANPEADHVST